MRAFSVIAVASISFVVGCNSAGSKQSEADRTKAAILRVMNQDRHLSEKAKTLPPNSTPTQVAWAFGQYCDALERLDMADCPTDFRVAYRHHIGAWREAEAAMKQMPNNVFDGVFIGFLNSAFRGEADGGRGRLEGQLKTAANRVRDTWIEVEKIGAKYGAAL